MTPRPRLRSIITLLLMLLFFIVNGTGETHAITKDEWWDHHWSYRLPLEFAEPGTVSNTLNFSQILNDRGLINTIIDLRSLQVVPYIDGIPSEPVPFEETFSHLIIDADQISIGTPPNNMYWAFSEESTSINIDEIIKTQGVGSLHAYIEISEYSNLNTGFYFFFNDSLLGNWSNYEVLLYDIYPDVHEVEPIDLETLFLFKLDGLMNCPVTYIDGPQLTTAAWNGIDLLLQPFGECQYPDYSAINKIRFIFEKDSNSYLENGDNLDIWVDNFRMFDQDADGQIIWNAEENIDRYYLYFNLLKEAEIPVYLPIVFR
jgi:hypothetical protein